MSLWSGTVILAWEKSPDRPEQFKIPEWLGEVIARSCTASLLAVIGTGKGSENKDRKLHWRVELSHALDQLDTIHVRHGEIGNHEVVVSALVAGPIDPLDGDKTIGNCFHITGTDLVQPEIKKLPDDTGVISNKYRQLLMPGHVSSTLEQALGAVKTPSSLHFNN